MITDFSLSFPLQGKKTQTKQQQNPAMHPVKIQRQPFILLLSLSATRKNKVLIGTTLVLHLFSHGKS